MSFLNTISDSINRLFADDSDETVFFLIVFILFIIGDVGGDFFDNSNFLLIFTLLFLLVSDFFQSTYSRQAEIPILTNDSKVDLTKEDTVQNT